MNPLWHRWIALLPTTLAHLLVGIWFVLIAFGPRYPRHDSMFPFCLWTLAFALSLYHLFSRLPRFRTSGASRGLILVGVCMGIGQVVALFLYLNSSPGMFHGIEFPMMAFYVLGASPLLYAFGTLTQGWTWEKEDLLPVLVLGLLVTGQSILEFNKRYKASYERAVQETPNQTPADLMPQQVVGEGFLEFRPLGALPGEGVPSLLEAHPDLGKEIVLAGGSCFTIHSGGDLRQLASYSLRDHDTKEYWYNAGTLLINDEHGNPPLTPTPAPSPTPVPDLHGRNYSHRCVGVIRGQGKDPWALVIVTEEGNRTLWLVGRGKDGKYDVDGARRIRLTSRPQALETVQAGDMDGDGTDEIAYSTGPYSEDLFQKDGTYGRSVSFGAPLGLELVAQNGRILFHQEWATFRGNFSLLPAEGKRKGLILADPFGKPLQVLDIRGKLVKECPCPDRGAVALCVWEGRTCLVYTREDPKDSHDRLYVQDLMTDRILFMAGLLAKPWTLKVFSLEDGTRKVLVVNAERGQEGSFLQAYDGKGTLLFRKPHQGQIFAKRREGGIEELLFYGAGQVTACRLSKTPAPSPAQGTIPPQGYP